MDKDLKEYEYRVTLRVDSVEGNVQLQFDMFGLDAHDFAEKLADFMKMAGYHHDNVDTYFDLE